MAKKRHLSVYEVQFMKDVNLGSGWLRNYCGPNDCERLQMHCDGQFLHLTLKTGDIRSVPLSNVAWLNLEWETE